MRAVDCARSLAFPLSSPRRLAVAVAVSLPCLALTLLTAWASVDVARGGFEASAPRHLVWLACLPFAPLFCGYVVRCTRHAAAGGTGLPDWSSPHRLLLSGLGLALAEALMMAPAAGLAVGGVSTLGLAWSTWSHSGSLGGLVAALLGSSAGLALLGGWLLYLALFLVFSPMVRLRAALGSGALGSLWPPGVWRDVRRDVGGYLACALLLGLVTMAFGSVQAAFLPLAVVAWPVQIYCRLVWASLLGVYARRSLPERLR